MNRANAILGMIAETPIHVGTGQSIGGIDLPIQREKHTGLPTIPGSSLKGALRETCDESVDTLLFGSRLGSGEHFAGSVALTDCRLLALPIRSSHGLFVWVTSRYILERLQRDLALTGQPIDLTIPEVRRGTALVSEKWQAQKVLLEDVIIETKKSPEVVKVARLLAGIALHQNRHSKTIDKMIGDLFIVSEDEMAYLSKYGTSVMARNQLEEVTKKSVNLWYAEMLPTDTLLYSLVMASDARNGTNANAGTVLKQLGALLEKGYLQLGGNETIGAGWVSVKLNWGQDVQRVLTTSSGGGT